MITNSNLLHFNCTIIIQLLYNCYTIVIQSLYNYIIRAKVTEIYVKNKLGSKYWSTNIVQ